MNQIYKIAKKWKVLLNILSAFVLVIAIGLSFSMINEPEAYEGFNFYFNIALCLGIFSLSIYLFMDSNISKYRITRKGISSTRAFHQRHLNMNEIKGFLHSENYIHIIPKDRKRKKIKIHYYINDLPALNYWLEKNLTDLNNNQYEDEEEDVWTNKKFGKTKKQREFNIIKLKRKTAVLNILGVLIGVSIFFFPFALTFYTLACIIYPLLVLFIARQSKGLISIEFRENSNRPNVNFAILTPCALLFLVALSSFQIYDYSNFWLLGGICFLLILAMFILSFQNINFNSKHFLGSLSEYIFISVALTYGSIIMLNVLFDSSDPELRQFVIVDKSTEIDDDNETEYYIEVKATDGSDWTENIEVSESFYKDQENGKIIKLAIKKGLFNIPHYRLVQ